jgi:hypothetical protein
LIFQTVSEGPFSETPYLHPTRYRVFSDAFNASFESAPSFSPIILVPRVVRVKAIVAYIARLVFVVEVENVDEGELCLLRGRLIGVSDGYRCVARSAGLERSQHNDLGVW